MTQVPNPPPSSGPPYYGPPAQSGRPRTISLLAVVFGGAALLFGLIPLVGLVVGGLFAAAAIVLGIIGILKSHKVMAIIGISLAALGMIISGAITGATFDAADYEDSADAPSRTIEPTTRPEPTEEPTTSEEPTEEPTTRPEPTEEATTSEEPTEEATTSAEPNEEPTTSAEPTEEPTTSPEAEEDSGGASDGSFGDGIWTVGEDIEPGTYSTTVPDESFGCYWERLSGFSGELDDIIANGNVEPGLQATVTIDSSDQGFNSQDCGTWLPAESEPQEDSGGASDGSFGDGIWTVGEDIEPGTYSTTVPDESFGCYWERLSGFSGELDDIIANGNVEPGLQATVTIDSSDQGFNSQDCGTWELQD
ncbi:hypothetical protein O1R50_12845 [Glycomyces luteolus]|uniref:Uncharacterized protein n=1 Tax=Glycomyces luteolus TaxID=2670330 RepID=A0A9X3PBJ2_9ACTN|nr:hypothetical protein [Glycomyces luteolus]MDA1360518.1 hypothetical protein [Glycomyces luteolus]